MPLYQLDGQAPELPANGRCFVADNAVLIGRVRLHEDTGVWFGAVARGDGEWIEIGAGSNVQDNCTLHTDPGFPVALGEGCTVGHNVILHGCTIGAHSLIGMGAIIMNGARIGSNCIVGAGAIVTEGKEFPDRSLIIGTPAKIARTLDDAAVELIAQSARRYVENARRFAAGLRPVG